MAYFSGFGGHFGVFLGFLGRTTGTFISFFSVTSRLREGVGVLAITPHLLNISAEDRRACKPYPLALGSAFQIFFFSALSEVS